MIYLFWFGLIWYISSILIYGVYGIVMSVYDLRRIRQHEKNKESSYTPLVSVLIPAYNEQKDIAKAVLSVKQTTYPNKEIIVIDDGSTDETGHIVNRLISKNDDNEKLRLLKQTNSGKGAALNYGLNNANGELVMVLDADSAVSKSSISRMVSAFKDDRVIALAACTHIGKYKNFVGLLQRLEFIYAFELKKALPVLNINIIVGGVGSTFRRDSLLSVGGYDSDTPTEDMDLTMKLIEHFGNQNYIIGYASDVDVYTQPVKTFRQLVNQRFRWRMGFDEVLFKYKKLLFNRNRKYSMLLTFYMLPIAVMGEVLAIINTSTTLFVLFYLVYMLSIHAWLSNMALLLPILVFILLMITSSSDSVHDKKYVTCFSFIMAIPWFIYAQFLDFCTSIRVLFNVKKIFNRKCHTQSGSWKHVDR